MEFQKDVLAYMYIIITDKPKSRMKSEPYKNIYYIKLIAMYWQYGILSLSCSLLLQSVWQPREKRKWVLYCICHTSFHFCSLRL